jgi:hypothetical protein
MRPNAWREPNAICPVCKTGFKKKRAWQVFCSAKCRGAMWRAKRSSPPTYEIRTQLDELKAAIDRVERYLGIKSKERGHHESSEK